MAYTVYDVALLRIDVNLTKITYHCSRSLERTILYKFCAYNKCAVAPCVFTTSTAFLSNDPNVSAPGYLPS